MTMLKEGYLQFRRKVLVADLLVFFLFAGLLIASYYNLTIWNIFLSEEYSQNFLDSYLWFLGVDSANPLILYLWSVLALFLIPINFVYWSEKGYYDNLPAVKSRNRLLHRPLPKIVSYFFYVLALINFLVIIIGVEELIWGNFGLPFTLTLDWVFYLLPVLVITITLALGAKILK